MTTSARLPQQKTQTPESERLATVISPSHETPTATLQGQSNQQVKSQALDALDIKNQKKSLLSQQHIEINI